MHIRSYLEVQFADFFFMVCAFYVLREITAHSEAMKISNFSCRSFLFLAPIFRPRIYLKLTCV